jgi:hypothetical protein
LWTPKIFDAYSLLTDEVSDPPLTRHAMMEKYAQQASNCFIPFSNIKDLKDAKGNFLNSLKISLNEKFFMFLL